MRYRMASLARVMSYHSEHPKYKMGAVISYKGTVVGVGFNKCKTHPRSKSYTIHAELSAIINSKGDCLGCDIYVFRGKYNGGYAMAHPCRACMELIREAGIRTIYYTDERGWQKEVV